MTIEAAKTKYQELTEKKSDIEMQLRELRLITKPKRDPTPYEIYSVAAEKRVIELYGKRNKVVRRCLTDDTKWNCRIRNLYSMTEEQLVEALEYVKNYKK